MSGYEHSILDGNYKSEELLAEYQQSVNGKDHEAINNIAHIGEMLAHLQTDMHHMRTVTLHSQHPASLNMFLSNWEARVKHMQQLLEADSTTP